VLSALVLSVGRAASSSLALTMVPMMKSASVTIPIQPSTTPAIAIPRPDFQPLARLIWLNAMCPKMTAKIEPIQ
jgi:hypothetical protein